MKASSRRRCTGSRSEAAAAALRPATTPWPAASSYPVVPLTWPARKSPGNRLELEGRTELRRREIVVLDGIPGSGHLDRFQPGHRAQVSSCTAGGSEVERPFTYISLVSKPLGLQKDLVPAASGNRTILSSMRRAVPRAATTDRPAVQRRFLDVPGDDLLQPLIRMGEIAGQLRWMRRSLVVGEPVRLRPHPGAESGPIDRPSVDPRRGSRLEAFSCKSLCSQ